MWHIPSQYRALMPRWQWGMPVNFQPVQTSFSKPGYQHRQQFEYGILGASASILWRIPGLLRIVSPSPFTFRSMGNLINTLLPVLAYHPCKQSLLFLNSGTFWTWFTVTPGAVQSQTWILYSRVAPASAVEEIIHWNNPPNREASGLVRKGVGQWVIFRAVATPVPAVYPIPSHPMFI